MHNIKHRTLQDLTGHESGGIKFKNGEQFALNWSSHTGIPRGFFIGYLDGYEFEAIEIYPTNELIEIIHEEEKDLNEPLSIDGFRCWDINNGEAQVIVQSDWA